MKPWKIHSWKDFPAKQQPEYPDQAVVENILTSISKHPPLVFSGEVEKLKSEIAQAGLGQRFILQGGDCAERFIDCNSTTIANKLKILLQMSVVLAHGARKPVIRIGRIAGQYGKPRSTVKEVVNGETMYSYFGDIVNDFEATPAARVPDPARMLKGYFHSASTLNFIRAMIDGGFADLHHPERWELANIRKTERWAEYEETIDRILDSVYFMEAFTETKPDELGKIEFYTSHEGLLLGYESALTLNPPRTEKYYNLGAHMLWIGERTRQLDGAHIEYFRGIANPIGVKVGPTMEAEELVKLIKILNPHNEPGRLTLITRMGKEKIREVLPRLIRAVQDAGQIVTWTSDPMHSNTIKLDNGMKTRPFDMILDELSMAFSVHRENDSYLGGVHFELTGDDVTECVGGAQDLKGEELSINYQTYCDPRLNYTQSLEMAFLMAQKIRG